MARARPENKREAQPALPALQGTVPAAKLTRVLPMDLGSATVSPTRTREWEINGRPYTTNAGKNARVLLQKFGYQPNVTELRRWSAHQRISVKRGS